MLRPPNIPDNVFLPTPARLDTPLCVTSPDHQTPLAVLAEQVPPKQKRSGYPEPFRSIMANRDKRALGEAFGLTNFGVNLTRLAPGGESALLHRHSKQDEFIYVLEGEATLVTDRGEITMRPGMCAGFPAAGHAHHIVNRSDGDVVILEVGDRARGDEGYFPADDIKAVLAPDGNWTFCRKDGSRFPDC